MNSRATEAFWRRFRELPPDIQKTSIRRFRQWVTDPGHPSVRFKKIGDYWSARAAPGYRALGVMRDDTVIWFWIGNHDDYEDLPDRG